MSVIKVDFRRQLSADDIEVFTLHLDGNTAIEICQETGLTASELGLSLQRICAFLGVNSIQQATNLVENQELDIMLLKPKPSGGHVS